MDNHASIVIKKVKKGGHGGHHGGAWKVAYADFVTAMMAFFLLLWLLNATSEEQKLGISNYFDPTAISRNTRTGSGGVLGGNSVTVPGGLKSDSTPFMISAPQPARPQAENTDSLEADSDDPENIESRFGSDNNLEGLINAEKLKELLEMQESAQFAAAEKILRETIEGSNDPELKEVADSLQIDYSQEGLRIQLLDQEKVALFPLGSAEMLPQTRKLMAKVAEIISKLPNKIKISGHTDSRPFPAGALYTNWELSADRALSSRRELLANGILADRIAQVVGMADTDPIEPNDPTSPSNRRISIVLLKQDFSDQAADALASRRPAMQPRETIPAPVIAPDTGSALPPLRSGG